MRALIASSLTLMALLIGCGDDFAPRSLLQSYRVIGVVAEPPEMRPTDTAVLRAVEYDPARDPVGPEVEVPSGPLTYRWTICLFSLGSTAIFACADERLQKTVTTDGPELELNLMQVIADLNPQSVAETADAAFDLGSVCDLAAGCPITVILESGREGAIQKTAKSIKVKTEGTLNQNPTLGALALAPGAVLEPGGMVDLRLEVPEGASETYVDEDGASVTEELLDSWYTTAGEFDLNRTYDGVHENTLTLPDTAGPVRVYAVIRDGRGGAAVTHLDLEVRDP